MNIKTTIIPTTETLTIESIEVAEGVEVLRSMCVRESPPGAPTTVVTERVRCTRESDDQYYGFFYIVEPELLEILRTTGWFHDTKHYKLLSEQPFKRVQENKPYEVVRVRDYDHSIYTVNDEPLPVAILFNEIDGRANDAHFDLEKLVAHLQTRDDVTLLPGHWSSSLVQRVPGYNAGDSCGYNHITFRWHPSVEVFRQYKAQMAAIGKEALWKKHDIAHTLMGNDVFRIENPYEADDDDRYGGD
jgi:hypothetical protein